MVDGALEAHCLDSDVRVRQLACQPYVDTWQAMQTFTHNRSSDTTDELWVVEHAPVFTLGQAAKPEHVLDARDIPLVQTDRGGQVTYHGPGQLVIYPLLDLRRKKLGVKALVTAIEQAVIDALAQLGLMTERRSGAPGIYIQSRAQNPNQVMQITERQTLNSAIHPAESTQAGAKIAALGLRVRQMRSYHGLSVNVDMDLAPFLQINPCGYANMPVTDIRTELAKIDEINNTNLSDQQINISNIRALLIESLCTSLNLNVIMDA